MPVVSVPDVEEREFDSLISILGLDRSQFVLELTEHPAATFGPRVKTIKISWKEMLEAEYGAAEPTSWVAQFRADWDSGLIPGIVADTKAT
ncbi:MAG: hypothetical protein Q7U63_14470 [Polaromonas sp.]|uniref:hypothetical protein n=1 Tax=Polaromonas sp. TaxID=1869339 RepID=UPI0027157535|nr:hypothetical protein [Polaromonas sp.]MDO9114981.1 hypothetical protein [Polaromonas sp.]MDP1885569.1 hypothetical protein [Polaromonas sp.]